MKGVFRLKPVFPKYNITWDPNPVLEHFNSIGPLHTLPLDKLTYKLIVLLALTTSQRVQTLTKIKLSNINYLDDRLEIIITDLIKTSSPSKCQPIIILPYFTNIPGLCIATVSKHYITVTENVRANHDFLLLTIKKPHRPATCQTVSKWIKKVLTIAGVNTN
ncbi:unnamed protein product, partial [Callosobruchus maculatus]